MRTGEGGRARKDIGICQRYVNDREKGVFNPTGAYENIIEKDSPLLILDI